jgi:hypothetical protein
LASCCGLVTISDLNSHYGQMLAKDSKSDGYAYVKTHWKC